MGRVTLDFETRSRAELRRVGAFKYSLDPSTLPTCLAYRLKGSGNPVTLLKFHHINRRWWDQPEWFRKLWISWIDAGFLFTAHNAFFEKCIYENVLVARYGWPSIPDRQYRCTAAKAAACALPRNLEGAGYELGLSVQKDRRGYNAMIATCKPTKAWNAWTKARADHASGVRLGARRLAVAEAPEPPVFLEPEAAPDVWETLYTYCKIDVASEEAVDDALPDLIPQEQEVWFLNQRINWRGIPIDLPLVRKIITMMESESKKKRAELDTLTMGLVKSPFARNSILEFLALDGVVLPDLKAKTVEDNLSGFHLTEDMHRLLEIRKALAMASVKKYQAMVDRTCEDGRARDIVLYHAASTGRDGGTGIQPHNFPRGLLKVDKRRPYAAVENVIECDFEMLQLLYGSSLNVLFSAILRSMIVPDADFELFVGDFSKVEVVVLWWLAKHEEGLDLIRSGLDVYRHQAAENLGVEYLEVPEEGDDRQLGKAQILLCGFRGGWKKFMDTAWTMYRLKLTRRQSFNAVKAYRETHSPVVELWEAYEAAAVAAVEQGGVHEAGRCRFFVQDRFLWVELPSGRRLAYFKPQLVMRTITYTALVTDPQTGEDLEVERTSDPKPTVQFLGLDKTKKKLQVEFTHGGILAENITQAVARDLMMTGILNLESMGYRPYLTVHDEAVTGAPKGRGDVQEFNGGLTALPPWALGMPLEAKSWTGPRYRKG